METINITPFFRLLDGVRILHWSVAKHSHHVAFGECYDALSEKADELVEDFKGNFPEVNMVYGDTPMDGINVNEPYESFRSMYNEFRTEMEQCAKSNSFKSLLDDMDVIANKCCYLLRMN